MSDVCRSCQCKVPPDAKECPACGQPQMHPCPFCAEPIRIEAVKCRHCKTFLDGRGSPSAAATSGGQTCPYCQQQTRFIPVEQISVAGWVIFAVLVATCLPLCWIGLLMKETKYRCTRCSAFRP
jgi:hypothetical protein